MAAADVDDAAAIIARNAKAFWPKPRALSAPLAILDCVSEGLAQPFDGRSARDADILKAHQRREPRNKIRTLFSCRPRS